MTLTFCRVKPLIGLSGEGIFQTYRFIFNYHLKSDGAVKGQPGGKGNVPDGGSSSGNQQYVRRINNDAREDEMEDNMQMVGGILGDLKSMAIDMGGEIEKQNSQLDRVNAKVYFLFYLFIRSRNLNEESGLGIFILFGIIIFLAQLLYV